MPRPTYNPFSISESDASANVAEELRTRRIHAKWKRSRANRSDKPPGDGKFVVFLDEHISNFLHSYSNDIKADYSSTLMYLLGPLVKARMETKGEKYFSVASSWLMEREGSGDFNKDNNK